MSLVTFSCKSSSRRSRPIKWHRSKTKCSPARALSIAISPSPRRFPAAASRSRRDVVRAAFAGAAARDLIQYDRNNVATQIIFADRADFTADRWQLENASLYRFNPDGTLISEPRVAQQQVELGEKPTDIVKRLSQNDPENLSRAEIADIVHSGQLTQTELRKYVTTYQEKLAQPFACFVFVLIAIPYGLRAARNGGGTSVGFGVAVLDRLRLLHRADGFLVRLAKPSSGLRRCGRGCRTSSSPRSAWPRLRRAAPYELGRSHSRQRHGAADHGRRRRHRVRRRSRRASGRAPAPHALRHSSALHVDDRCDRHRHADRAERDAGRVACSRAKCAPPSSV